MCSLHGSFLQLFCRLKFFFQKSKLDGEDLCATTILFSSAPVADHSSLIRPFLTLSLYCFPYMPVLLRIPLSHDAVQQTQVPVSPETGIFPSTFRPAGQNQNHNLSPQQTTLLFPSWLLSRKSQSSNPVSSSSSLATPSWRLKPASPPFSAVVPAAPKSFLASLAPVVLTFFSEW